MLLKALWVAFRSAVAASTLTLSVKTATTPGKKRYAMSWEQGWSHRFWFSYAILMAHTGMLKAKHWRWEALDWLLPIGAPGYSHLLGNFSVFSLPYQLECKRRKRTYGIASTWEHLKKNPRAILTLRPKPLTPSQLRKVLNTLPWSVSPEPRGNYIYFLEPDTHVERHARVFHHEYCDSSAQEPSSVFDPETQEIEFSNIEVQQESGVDLLKLAEAIDSMGNGDYFELSFMTKFLDQQNVSGTPAPAGTSPA